MKSSKERNHYLPRLLLKNWSNSSGFIKCYKIFVPNDSVPLWRNIPPKGTGYKKHLYSKINTDGSINDLEDWIERTIETPATEPIEKILNDSLMTPSDWEKVIRFAVLQHFRTPAAFFEHLNFAIKELPQIQKNVLNELKTGLVEGSIKNKKTRINNSSDRFPYKYSEIPDDDPKSDLVKIKIETTPGRSTWLFDLKKRVEKFTQIACKHKWTIIKPSHGYSWPINDRALIRLNYCNEKEYDFKGGWGRENGNLLLPIGPQHLMITQIGLKARLYKRGTRVNEFTTNLFRRLIAESAFEYLYSEDEDAQLSRYRRRVVDLEGYNLRKKFWHIWHNQQSEIELNND